MAAAAQTSPVRVQWLIDSSRSISLLKPVHRVSADGVVGKTSTIHPFCAPDQEMGSPSCSLPCYLSVRGTKTERPEVQLSSTGVLGADDGSNVYQRSSNIRRIAKDRLLAYFCSSLCLMHCPVLMSSSVVSFPQYCHLSLRLLF